MASADNVGAGVAKQLLHSLGQIPNGGSICLLNEQIAGVGVLESEHDQIHSLVQIHQETSHVGVGDGNGVARLDLVNEQRNDGAAAAHDIAVAGAADGGAAALGCHAGVGIDHMLHHGLGNAHGVDGIGSFIRRKAHHALYACINGGVQHIVGADDVGLHRLHGEKLTAGHLLKGGSMEDIVYAGHGIPNGLGVAHIANVKFHLVGVFRVLGLQLVAHIVLLFLIAGENADLFEVRVQKML